MPEQFERVVPIAVLALTLIFLIFRPKQSALKIGVVGSVWMAVLVPSFSTSANVAIAAVLGGNIILVIAILRDRRTLLTGPIPYALLAFILWTAIVGSVGAPRNMVLLYLATGTFLGLLALCVIGAVGRGHVLFVPLFAAVVFFEFCVGLGEQFFGTSAMWPRADGSDLISHRANSVAPWLIGRSMGSTSQPIPYGILVAFCIIVCVWFAIKNRSIVLGGIAGIGLVALVFSGTRNAILGLGVAAVAWFVFMFWRKKRIIIPFAIVVVLAVPAALLYVLRAGGSDFTESSSFAHRLGILETAGSLFLREPGEILFGTGYSSIRELISSGLISGVDGLTVLDQEFIRTFVATGAVGLILLIVAAIQGLRKGNTLTRVLIVFLLFGFVAFDSLSWRLLQTLFVFVLAYGYGLTPKQPSGRGTHKVDGAVRSRLGPKQLFDRVKTRVSA